MAHCSSVRSEGYFLRTWSFCNIRAHSSADGICAHYPTNIRLCQVLFPDSLLEHDPTHDDIRAFLGRLKTALAARDLTLCGVTTDGSALYPAPLLEVFG